jgi:hypothetical protein
MPAPVVVDPIARPAAPRPVVAAGAKRPRKLALASSVRGRKNVARTRAARSATDLHVDPFSE